MKKIKIYSDQDLVEGLVYQQDEVLKQFYELYFKSILHLVISNLGTKHDAKDVFQDAMLVLFQNARKGEFKLTSSLKTYIYSVSRLIWIKELKKRSRTEYRSKALEKIEDNESNFLEVYEHNERLDFYREIFITLSEDCQRLLKMFLIGESVGEITRKMGYKTEQHTKNRRYRCKMSLIQRIKSSSRYKEFNYENNPDNRAIPGWYTKRG